MDSGGTEQDGDEDDEKWWNLKVDLPVDWIEVEFWAWTIDHSNLMS